MKAKFFSVTAVGLLLIVSSCHKTYNCTCEPDIGHINGQVKAINDSKAKDRCDKNCGHSHSSVSRD